MGRPSTLDSTDFQEHIFEFCRSCGSETYHGQNCWDGIISKSQYFKYKASHPEFAKKVEESCKFFFAITLKTNPHRLEDIWSRIDDRVKHGYTEVRIYAQFKYKTDEKGKLLIDPHTRQPIPDELIGTARQQLIHRPCESSLLQWLVDKYEQVSQEL